MPCDAFKVSPTATTGIWWIQWHRVWWPTGRASWCERRAKVGNMLAFCKRHGIPAPELPDRKRGAQ